MYPVTFFIHIVRNILYTHDLHIMFRTLFKFHTKDIGTDFLVLTNKSFCLYRPQAIFSHTPRILKSIWNTTKETALMVTRRKKTPVPSDNVNPKMKWKSERRSNSSKHPPSKVAQETAIISKTTAKSPRSCPNKKTKHNNDVPLWNTVEDNVILCEQNSLHA